MIKPKSMQIKNQDGLEKTFIISRVPAVPMRELIAKYPVANIPKLGEYHASKEAMLLLMSFVAVQIEDRDEPQRLVTEALVNSHVEDGEQLLRLEFEMLRYNTSFFGQGGASTFLSGLIKKHLPLIIQTLMDSLPPSLVRDLHNGPSSKQP